jgi:hypothetical protein
LWELLFEKRKISTKCRSCPLLSAIPPRDAPAGDVGGCAEETGESVPETYESAGEFFEEL